MLVGFGFKVAAAPFHQWSPDVYQGAPSPVTAFMSSAVKAAAFAGMLRVFVVAFDDLPRALGPDRVRAGGAVAARRLGHGGGQTNVKRMLAYSSINHAGFILVGVEAASARGTSAALVLPRSATR